jgi:NTE family protein
MGAVVGGLYAGGMSPGELTRFVIDEFDITDYLDSFVFRINGPIGRVFKTGQILGSLAARSGIDSGQRILDLLVKLTGGKTFAEAKIPFRCNALDLAGGAEVVFDSGPLARAIRASMSVPAIFEPLVTEGMCLVDGGLADNMPVHIAAGEGFKRILAVDVGNFKALSPEELTTGPKIVYRSMEAALKILSARNDSRASLTIHIRGEATSLSFFRKKELIALGERVVLENKKAVEAFFGGGVGAFFKRKRYRNIGV